MGEFRISDENLFCFALDALPVALLAGAVAASNDAVVVAMLLLPLEALLLCCCWCNLRCCLMVLCYCVCVGGVPLSAI